MPKTQLITATILAAALAGPTHAEEIYLPADTFDPEILAALPLESLSYVGMDNRLTVVMPTTAPVMRIQPPELEEGLIACINGKAMFREDGKRRFLSVAESRPYCDP